MKKLIACLLTGVLLTSTILAGCGSTEEKSQTEPAEESSVEASDSEGENEPAESEDESADLEGSIRIWCWDETFNVLAAQKAGELFETAHPGVKTVVEVVSQNDINTKLTAAATSGDASELPDIILENDRNVGKYVTLYPEMFADLTNSGINYDDFASYKVGYNTVDGKLWGVPFDSGVAVLAVRTDILDTCGYTVSDLTDITWKEFIEIGKDVYAKSGCNLLIDRSDVAQLLNIMIQSSGSWYFDMDGNLDIAGNANLAAVFEVYKELVENNIVALYNNGDAYNNALWSGTTAGVIQGCWVMSSIKKGEDQSGNWALTNVPKLNDVDGATNYSNNGGGSWMVINNDNTELSIAYLAETFGGSVELYNEILPLTSAIATYLPARESENYLLGDEFFSGQTVYKDIMDYAAKVPQINYALYSSEAYDAIATAMTDVLNGKAVADALKEAEDTVAFQMQ